ncbi:DNA-binding response regulator, OmpR family, contains REC and winged-helix (wHTH) domain [Gemmiger formicilis]|uniref:Stage 0 sporulation protein A homolog n=1 Tax=Gemmiger formicilis TaxID=745368 RepID=A0A1T4Y8L2_9FIRM|nr:response regulator transcription factor [Gemmiger formicilis]SKA98129.1 DNA-binding response regulator, OmpR family, contains REC and winged-helix (wHTH) domain [Gemmiger formicilis]
MKTIAVIEDDQHIGNIIENALKKEGYGVLRAYSGTEALYLLSHNTPDLILLDLMLPGLAGEEILSKMDGIPVIVVSAKVGIDDKVNLLLSGAVDYITKPFEIRELLARISVQFRKEEKQSLISILKVDNLVLDLTSHEVTVNDTQVHLTKTEYAIFKLLMQNPNQVISKTVILERIFEDTPDCTDRSLKQHISNLRKKLRDAGDKEYIEAVWGIGFKITF